MSVRERTKIKTSSKSLPCYFQQTKEMWAGGCGGSGGGCNSGGCVGGGGGYDTSYLGTAGTGIIPESAIPASGRRGRLWRRYYVLYAVSETFVQ